MTLTLIRRLLFLLLVTMSCSGLLGVAQDATETLLFDFEKTPLSKDWSALGGDRIEAVREMLPASEAKGRFAPSGQGVTVRSKGSGGLVCLSKHVPNDWSVFDTLGFWVYRSPNQHEATIEVQLYEADGKAKLWRRLTIEHTGWKHYSVPLSWCRWSDGRIPRWNRIDRFGFWFREPAVLSLDSITLSPAPAARGDFLSGDVLATLPGVFGNNRLRRKKTAEVELLTTAADVDIDTLASLLTKRAEAWRQDLSFLDRSNEIPLLVVLADRTEYEQFVMRLGSQFNSVAPAPKSDGYSILGVATSYWDERHGMDRPVYTHELFHSYLSRTLRLDTKGEWLHEGLATMYQLRAHPQDSMSELVTTGLANERFRMPLQQLCSSERIPENRYWQAATLIEMMLATPKYKAKLPRLFAAFQRLGTTNLDPHLELLETSWTQLFDDWAAYCRTKYEGR